MSEKYKEVQKSEFEEFEKEILLDEIDIEGNNFETYKEVYLNSFYINIYSILESALLRICVNYCNTDYKKMKKMKSNESLIKISLNTIQKTAGVEFTEIQPEFEKIDKEFRLLRNCLIHSRYTCKETDVENLKNLRFITVPFHSKPRLQIEHELLVIDFIIRVVEVLELQ